jgi:hypothetical protein
MIWEDGHTIDDEQVLYDTWGYNGCENVHWDILGYEII